MFKFAIKPLKTLQSSVRIGKFGHPCECINSR